MRSRTSPTRTMRETSLGRARSLWIRAKARSRRSAMEVALDGGERVSFSVVDWWCGEVGVFVGRPLRQVVEGMGTYRFAPPASGLTMTALSTSRLDLIQRRVLGSAYKLSTGTLKKPCIWLAWRSMVMTWLQPAVCSMFAMSLAVIGALDLSFLSCRA